MKVFAQRLLQEILILQEQVLEIHINKELDHCEYFLVYKNERTAFFIWKILSRCLWPSLQFC